MNRDQAETQIDQLLQNFIQQFKRAKNFKSIPSIEMDSMLDSIRVLYQTLYDLKGSIGLPVQVSFEKPSIAMEENVVAKKIDPVLDLPTPDISAPSLAVNESDISDHDTDKLHIAEVTERIPVLEMSRVEVIERIQTQELEEEIVVTHKNKQEEVQIAAALHRETIFNEQPKAQPKAVASLFDDTPTIGDHFKEQPSLNHKIGTVKNASISDKHKKEPVGDLKKYIGINEKFSFINVLFSGNQQLYAISIDELNSAASYLDAQSHFNSLAENLKWNSSSTSYLELQDLIKRRFDA